MALTDPDLVFAGVRASHLGWMKRHLENPTSRDSLGPGGGSMVIARSILFPIHSNEFVRQGQLSATEEN